MNNIRWQRYPAGIGLVILATLLGHLVHTFFAPANIIMIYLLSVTVSAVTGGLGPSILVSVLGVLAFDFFFVSPFYTFAVDDTQYIFTFSVLLLVGITISYLTSRIRKQTEIARIRERQTAALYALGRDLVASNNLASYITAITKRIEESTGLNVTILLPEYEHATSLKTFSADNSDISRKEMSVAIRSLQEKCKIRTNHDPPNAGTKLYLPLTTARGGVGVMVLCSNVRTPEPNPMLDHLIGAYADLVAVAIEGIQMAEEIRDAQLVKATEKLQNALLNAISHDLRTPLVSIIGTLSSLQEESIQLDSATKHNLVKVAREEADRLNHLISNLLDESRLKAGVLCLNRQPSEIQDLVGAALEQLKPVIQQRPVLIEIPDSMPFIFVDFGLVVQVLANIIENATKYSPPDSPVEIRAFNADNGVKIEITDRGIGIPEQDLEHIFDRFYRIKHRGNVAGTGLGLSISRDIIELHGGRIKAGHGPAGGTQIIIELPVDSDNGSTGKHEVEKQ
ncbi:MAG: DUF4118 domain-containing protein [Dehalococcoidaceae bacterium]|nr:DUF4118 domain-containing protein [Dehalococcoidaceae bacterium]